MSVTAETVEAKPVTISTQVSTDHLTANAATETVGRVKAGPVKGAGPSKGKARRITNKALAYVGGRLSSEPEGTTIITADGESLPVRKIKSGPAMRLLGRAPGHRVGLFGVYMRYAQGVTNYCVTSYFDPCAPHLPNGWGNVVGYDEMMLQGRISEIGEDFFVVGVSRNLRAARRKGINYVMVNSPPAGHWKVGNPKSMICKRDGLLWRFARKMTKDDGTQEDIFAPKGEDLELHLN